MPDTNDQTESLGLPYIQPAQAQKHVTHNEALRRLDVLVQLRVAEFLATQPPADPQEGAVYALDSGASDAWAGHDGDLAVFSEGVWDFITPREGWLAVAAANGKLRVWQGGLWRLAQAQTDNLTGIGIGGAADATNRLLVSASASLFTHEGNGHQIKVNKAGAGDTASLLFQTSFSGRAEMGLAGSDNWSIKTSADGNTWVTALSLNAATGIAGGSAVQATRTDVTVGRLMRADYGYGPGNLLGSVSQSGGVPTGKVIERGSNANGRYVKFADGTLICTTVMTGVDITTATNGLFASANQTWTFPAAFTDGDWTGGGRLANSGTGVAVHVTGAGSTSPAAITAYALNSNPARTLSLFAIGRWF